MQEIKGEQKTYKPAFIQILEMCVERSKSSYLRLPTVGMLDSHSEENKIDDAST